PGHPSPRGSRLPRIPRSPRPPAPPPHLRDPSRMSVHSPSSAASGAGPSATQRALLSFFLDHLVWFILALVLIIFSLTISQFFQIGIFVNILRQATFVGILSIGLTFVIIAGHLDLSIESVMAFAAMIAAYLVATGGE